ncbi:MAG: hypothetical protein COY81_01250 [Candidatus Pacebacteria bacterium CG_4_10_14_0_8_um_filter_43_12]|nr:MAG: hypothetical protein COY81_01250 [Candidatus Pacebacteria bacterium CG_4_10_14_0_8_um_filter_43_12]
MEIAPRITAEFVVNGEPCPVIKNGRYQLFSPPGPLAVMVGNGSNRSVEVQVRQNKRIFGSNVPNSNGRTVLEPTHVGIFRDQSPAEPNEPTAPAEIDVQTDSGLAHFLINWAETFPLPDNDDPLS